MRTPIITVILLFATALTLFGAVTEPALSPDGKHLLFCYRGDIFLCRRPAQVPTRLTVHVATDDNPVWAHDNQTIYFLSLRSGSYDIYRTDTKGSRIERMTYTGNVRKIFCTDSAGRLYFAYNTPFHSPAIGVLEPGDKRIKHLFELHALYVKIGDMYTADGEDFYFSSGSMTTLRPAYKGSGAYGIYRYSRATGACVPVVAPEVNAFNPLIRGERLYYIAAVEGVYNVFSLDLAGKETQQLTEFTDRGMFSLTLAADTGDMVFERNFALYCLQPDGSVGSLSYDLPGDYAMGRLIHRRAYKEISELAVSPDDRYLALVVLGDVYLLDTKDTDSSRAQNITASTCREHSVQFSHDGTRLLYVTDADGNPDVCLYDVASGETKRITQTPVPEKNPCFSPDDKQLAYNRQDKQLVVYDLAKGEEKPFDLKMANHMNWARDNRHLAMSALVEPDFEELVILDTQTGRVIAATQSPGYDYATAWGAAGKYLYYIGRDIYLYFGGDDRLYQLALDRRETGLAKPEPVQMDKKDTDKKKDGTDEKQPVTITIREQGIKDRSRSIFSGNPIWAIAEGDNTLYVMARKEESRAFSERGHQGVSVYKLDLAKEEKTLIGELPRSDAFAYSKKYFYSSQGGGLFKLPFANLKKREPIAYETEVEISRPALFAQLLTEVYYTLKFEFYDPKMHNRDWSAIYEFYRAFIPDILRYGMLETLVERMLGELNASHMGYNANSISACRVDSFAMGFLGVDIDRDFAGPGLKIKAVLPNSPATFAAVNLRPGDVITAVNGETVAADQDMAFYLSNTQDKKISLTVRRLDGPEDTVWLKPASFWRMRELNYQDWVRQNRELVRQKSDEQIAYFHIQGMNKSSLVRFVKEYTTQSYGKKGIIIDVRYNGGGWTHEYLLMTLSFQTLGLNYNRWQGFRQTPIRSFAGKRVLLMNQYSASDAEIFPYGFKTFGLGTLIGVATPGYVIGTGGHQLMDGSYMRLPRSGWYGVDEKNMENMGVEPDITVPLTFNDMLQGRDPQLERAIEEILRAPAPAGR